jgi:hypothetical protein
MRVFTEYPTSIKSSMGLSEMEILLRVVHVVFYKPSVPRLPESHGSQLPVFTPLASNCALPCTAIGLLAPIKRRWG